MQAMSSYLNVSHQVCVCVCVCMCVYLSLSLSHTHTHTQVMSRHYNRNSDTSTNVQLQTRIAEWVGGDDHPEVSQQLVAIDEDLNFQLDPEQMRVHDVPVTRPVRLIVSDTEWHAYLKSHHPDQCQTTQPQEDTPSGGPLQPRRSPRVRRNLFTENVLDLARGEEDKEDEDEEDEEAEEDEDNEEAYIVDEILDEKPDKTGTFMLFLIKWQGYDNSANSWVSYDQLATCLDAYNTYLLRKHASAASSKKRPRI